MKKYLVFGSMFVSAAVSADVLLPQSLEKLDGVYRDKKGGCEIEVSCSDQHASCAVSITKRKGDAPFVLSGLYDEEFSEKHYFIFNDQYKDHSHHRDHCFARSQIQIWRDRKGFSKAKMEHEEFCGGTTMKKVKAVCKGLKRMK